MLIVLILLHNFGAGMGEVVRTQNNILRRGGNRFTGSRREDVVGRKHEQARLQLSFHGKRNVHGHLVSIEVSIVPRAHQRVQTNG